ncbi:hypothetical protein ABIC28_000593 [Rhodococcus sp. PvR044]|jgi:hypothetical protein|nr:hypothetical protein [Rhodococcus sp. PvR099]PTR44428.1 hypothetical protein C8K38_104264 [Rhodococcus sp. OK611]SNX89869.1 hypothetical protein SAMN05447004_103263 [Rhodococcus sp. OK270]
MGSAEVILAAGSSIIGDIQSIFGTLLDTGSALVGS